jgi:hypothetical protein
MLSSGGCKKNDGYAVVAGGARRTAASVEGWLAQERRMASSIGLTWPNSFRMNVEQVSLRHSGLFSMDDVNSSLQVPPSLDERKFVQEGELRRKEIALKEREVAAKEAELLRSRWLNPTVIGLFAATIGLFGNLIVAFIGNWNSQQVEHSRSQSSLIIQAVGTGDAKSACKNLMFFLGLGLLDDPKGTISRCETSPNTIPVLPGVKTYTPVADTPWSEAMSPSVTIGDRADVRHVEVTFVIPAPPVATYKFNLVTLYGYQIDRQGQRSGDIQFPPVHGDWKVGDHVTVSADVPKNYVNDPARTSYLRFCVGSLEMCMPGPNLLIARVP